MNYKVILLLHLSMTGVDGLLLIMILTVSSIWQCSCVQVLRLSLDAAVDNLNSFSAESSSVIVLDTTSVAEQGGLFRQGGGTVAV